MPGDILKAISNTSLEGTVKYVDVTDVCKECSTPWYQPTRRVFDRTKTLLGAILSAKDYCNKCQKHTVWVITKIVPSKDQTDWALSGLGI